MSSMHMSSSIRTALRAASKPSITTAPGSSRAFHSPFAVLGNTSSPLTSPPAKDTLANHYEKHYDPALTASSSRVSGGYRTYVVSEADPHSRHYQVPAGAYPTSAPYVNFTATPAPDTTGREYSSTSSDLLAHGFTTRVATQFGSERNPQPDGGVAEKFSKAGVKDAWKLRK